MKRNSFTTAFTVPQSPEEVFRAINDVRAWWSGEISGETDRLGAEFVYRYGDIHRSVQRIVELTPGERIAWDIVDSRLASFEDPTEWNGTRVVFDIARRGDQTEVRFTHDGLVPAFACYGDCSGAWGFFVNESLRSLITSPGPRGQAG